MSFFILFAINQPKKIAIKRNSPHFLVVLLCIAISSFSQEKIYTSLTIPKELITDANAVVRDCSITIDIEDFDKMTVRERKVVTVLNKLGNVDAGIYEHYNNDTRITELKAIVYNAFGKEIKKYRERDFTDVNAVDGISLYSDAKVKYMDHTPVSYPYTIEIIRETKTSTTGFIPNWFPVNGYYVSVENSSFVVNNPNAIPWRIKEEHFKDFDIEQEVSNTQLKYTIKNQPAFEREYLTLNSRDFLPNLKVALNKFNLKGVEGSYTNWKEFGSWMYTKLLKGRDQVDEETKNKILALVSGLDDPVEKAKLVYNYVQNKVRYISVQVGIGGWEPIAANKVDEVSYGDCKGLTNYTKALLDIAGVESYYTIVYAKEKRNIDKDFSSIQGNHVILNIPNKGNDIWLECTSQSAPFGYLGAFTDDRDVLVVTPEGGVIKHTKIYDEKDNLEQSFATIKMTADGDLKAKIEKVTTGIPYDRRSVYANLTEDELRKRYKSSDWSYNNNLEVNAFNIQDDKDSIKVKENLEVSIKNYASLNNDEYLFRVNVFNRNNYVPKRYRNRKLPLKISRGYIDKDIYEIEIPESYQLEYLPENREITTKFGSYKLVFEKKTDKKLVYKRELQIKEGVFPKEDYKAYRSFRKKIAKTDNLRIAIKKTKT